MLACHPVQNFPLADEKHYLDYYGQNCLPAPQHTRYKIDATPSRLAKHRTPLVNLQNLFSQQRDNSWTHDHTESQMQHYTTTPLARNCSTHASNERDEHEPASGLGITTDENGFNVLYHKPSIGQESEMALHPSVRSATPLVPRNLSSPFDEQYYTPLSGFSSCHPDNTWTGNVPSVYAVTPNQNFLRPQDAITPSYYSASPIDFDDSSLHNTMQDGDFKRPVLKYRSNTSIASPNARNYYATPVFDPSTTQWMSHYASPGWEEHSDHPQSYTQTPMVTPDYSTYNGTGHITHTSHPHPATRSVTTYPLRRKPHLRPSLSESCVTRVSSPARMRTISMAYPQHAPFFEQHMPNGMEQQLPLPPLPPSVLINTPQMPMHSVVLPGTPLSAYRSSRSVSSTPQNCKLPSSPPPSDFENANAPYLIPIRQEPAFPGDLYTPRYKRRTANGRWEGWCGHCQPGRWLDLKNSRYWEDKLRNHGICAKTKAKFNEPEKIRWVAPDGSALPEHGLDLDNGDPYLDQKKREGLCGVCKTWISMDGMRTKARSRAVGWWMHAYKVRPLENKAGPI